MTLRFLLTLQMAFLPARTSAPGRPAEPGVAVEAYRAHLGGSAVSAGATVYEGDHFSTEGAAAAAVILYEKHRHKDVGSPDRP
jgi:hypothetical protein